MHNCLVPTAYIVAKTREYRGMARYTRVYGLFQSLYGTGLWRGLAISRRMVKEVVLKTTS